MQDEVLLTCGYCYLTNCVLRFRWVNLITGKVFDLGFSCFMKQIFTGNQSGCRLTTSIVRSFFYFVSFASWWQWYIMSLVWCKFFRTCIQTVGVCFGIKLSCNHRKKVFLVLMLFLYLVPVSQFLLIAFLDLFRRYHSHCQDHWTSRVKVLKTYLVQIILSIKLKAQRLLPWHPQNLSRQGFCLYCIS